MGNSEINKLLHDRLFEHEVPMDHDALWNAIQKKKNNKFPIIMLLSSLLVLVFSMSFFAFTFEELPEHSSTPLVANNLIDHEESTTTSSLLNGDTYDNDVSHNELNNTSEKSNKDLSKPKEIASAIIEKQAESIVNTKPIFGENAIALSHPGSTKEQQTKPQINDQKWPLNPTKEISLVSTHKANAADNKVDGATKPIIEYPSSLDIKLLAYKPMLLNESWGPSMLSRRKKQTGCFDHKIRRNSLGIELYAGPGVITKKMITSAADYKALLERRKETETSLESLRAGIAIRFNHHTGVYLKAGLEIGRLRERLDYSVGQDTSYTLENQIIDWEINTNGDSIPIFGTQTVTISSSKSWKVFNEFTTFDVPVLLGYQQKFGNWGVYGEIGAIFNISLTKKGMILDNTMTTPSELDPFFQSKNGIHLTAGIGASYRIADNVYVFASPNAKWSMSDFNDENYPINQRFHSYSILIGVGYEFSKGPKTL